MDIEIYLNKTMYFYKIFKVTNYTDMLNGDKED